MFLYLTLQLSSILGAAFFGALLLLWKRAERKSQSNQLKRLGQALLMTSLLSPLVLPSWTPLKTSIPQVMRKPLSESAVSLREVTQRPIAQGINLTTSNSLTNSLLPPFSISHLVLVLASLGVALGFINFLKNILSLRVCLSTTHRIRKYRSLSLGVSDKTTVPFSLWYCGRHWVVFPQEMLMDRTAFRISLKHELEHHRSGDTFWAFFLEAISPFFYFNPFFFSWKKALLELQEFSCDESLIGRKRLSPRNYGDCLLGVAEAALRNRFAPSGVAGMFNSKSSLERRIRMLASYKQKRPISFFITLSGVFSIVGLVLATLSLKSFAAFSPYTANPGIAVTDPKFQAVAEKHLFRAYSNFHATAAIAVVSEVNTGRVLAVANIDSEPSAPHSPHWALSLRVEPASMMKGIIAAAAIENGVTHPDDIHDCEKGKLFVGDKEFSDWKPFDKLTTAETVALSSNVCGIKIGMKLGAEKIQDSLKAFGFGESSLTGHFPEARAGVVPKIDELGADQYVARMPSGFGMYTTPLEIVQAFGAIANGGNLYQPLQANEAISPNLIRRVLTKESSDKMRDILLKVMQKNGTAFESQGKKFKLAGKTGTGYSPWLVTREFAKDSQIAHFVGFGPFEAPKYLVYVAVQDPKIDKDHKAHGSTHAAPVVRDILEGLLSQ